MDIVHITSELAPIAKVGGLADVIYGLSKALIRKGHHVRVILPKYDCIDYHLVRDLKVAREDFQIEENGIKISNTIWSAKTHEIDLTLVETHHPKSYFEREKIYGEEDDNERFLFFCKVASQLIQPNEIVHLHDWATAGCTLFKTNKTIFTIHCMEHQGRCSTSNIEAIGIDPNLEELKDPEFDAINLMRAAIELSDVVTTVSPTYMKEILTKEMSFGLEKVLHKHRKKLIGILNGIDFHYWDPQTDVFLVKPYSVETFSEGKKENKRHVLKHLNLEENLEKPLIVAVTRLASQKGPDLIHYGIEKAVELGGQFALLGSATDEAIVAQFKELEGHPNVAIRLEYDEPLSHLLYGASDFFLMPSIFEPCGLSQMIALRYGSIPIARETGGLKDTVFDPEKSEKPNGFTFVTPDNKGVSNALERAFAAYAKEEWDHLIQNAMQIDHSWHTSADKYIEIYQ